MQLKQNNQARAVSENRVVRDVSFVKNVGKRVKELVAEGHELFSAVGKKKAIRHIIEEEFGVCRQAVYMALRSLDLVSDNDKLYLKHRDALKKDLAAYGIGLDNNIATSSAAMSSAGVLTELCEKHGVSMTTMSCWVAALNFAAELDRDKRVLGKAVGRKRGTKSTSEEATDVLDNTKDHGDESDVPSKHKKVRKPRKPKLDVIGATGAVADVLATLVSNAPNRKTATVTLTPEAEVGVPALPTKRKYTRKDKTNNNIAGAALYVEARATGIVPSSPAVQTPVLTTAVAHGANNPLVGRANVVVPLVNFNVSISAISSGFRAGDYQLRIESADGLGNESTRVVVIDAQKFKSFNVSSGVDAIITALAP
jgi:hypothetical protein